MDEKYSDGRKEIRKITKQIKETEQVKDGMQHLERLKRRIQRYKK